MPDGREKANQKFSRRVLFNYTLLKAFAYNKTKALVYCQSVDQTFWKYVRSRP